MIKKDGKYILTIQDYHKICLYFDIKDVSTYIVEKPYLEFVETCFVDIHTGITLFSFHNHTGMIMIQLNTNQYEQIHINDILTKNAKAQSTTLLAIIKNKTKKNKRPILDVVTKFRNR